MSAPWVLTVRQEQILTLMAVNGMTSKECAYSIGISYKTVETHMGRALRTMKARNRIQAVAMWLGQRMKPTGTNCCPHCLGLGFVQKETH